jgi:hypothetical protein
MSAYLQATTHTGYVKFFRARLLTMTNEQISEYIDDLDKESDAIRTEALRMCWYMRGGITYDDAMQLSNSEKQLISKIIDENLETTKKTGLNFF